MFQAWSDINWLDQALHVLAGGAIVCIAMIYAPWWVGLALSMGVALAREQIQHIGRCGPGCRTDLAFWLAGSLAAVVTVWAMYGI